MTQLTIQCRLLANENVRQTLWHLMADKNTPLINELLRQIGEHPDFAQWRAKGKLPQNTIKNLCQSLKNDPCFSGQPSRFYMSAIDTVDYIFRSWLAIQRKLQDKLSLKSRWLEILKSDQELADVSGSSLKDLRQQAKKILAEISNHTSVKDTYTALFDKYNKSKEPLIIWASAYLLKNKCQLSEQPEDLEKFKLNRRKVEIQVERLIEQLEARLPKGRDLTGQKWVETLELAGSTVPESTSQSKTWQDILLTQSKLIPFPIIYESNEDLTWSKNSQGRICVKFRGLNELNFEVYCDQRQLKYFQRFLEDQQIKQQSKDKHSSALFTLRAGRLVWQESEATGTPWNVNHLTLYCTLDTRLWTAEGTELVKQEKAEEIAKILTAMKGKSDLTKNQQAFIKRRESTAFLLNQSFPRPSHPLYKGLSEIIVGVALGYDKVVTLAIINTTTGRAITYRSVKQLLGDNYKLINRQRQNNSSKSSLGIHLDRLLAKEIIKVAQSYEAGSIALPKTEDIREIIESEIKAKAEKAIPNCLEAQKEYAKQYRIQMSRWSYRRLIENIKIQADKLGIVIEIGIQPIRGSPQEQAKELALKAYQFRSRV